MEKKDKETEEREKSSAGSEKPQMATVHEITGARGVFKNERQILI